LEFHEPRIVDPLEPLCEGDGPFRPNVAGLILRRGGRETEILLGQRVDSPGAWQWPQGGMDPGETPEQALRREMREEIGIDSLRILRQVPFGLRYRFPVRLYARFRPNIGQEQRFFLVAPEPNDPPDLAKATEREFDALRWSPLSEALDSAIWFKRAVYREALAYAKRALPDLAL